MSLAVLESISSVIPDPFAKVAISAACQVIKIAEVRP